MVRKSSSKYVMAAAIALIAAIAGSASAFAWGAGAPLSSYYENYENAPGSAVAPGQYYNYVVPDHTDRAHQHHRVRSE